MHTAILLSAADKQGLVPFAGSLRALGWNLLGLRGTAEYLNGEGIPTRDISRLSPSMELIQPGVPRIDLVYADLFPLGKEVTSRSCTLASVTEKTDVDGIILLLWATKGRRFVLHSHKQFLEVTQYISDQWRRSPDWNEYKHEKFISALVGKAIGAVVQHLRVAANYHWDYAEGHDYKAVQEG
ncbi:MAG: hypothetical protein Q7R69_01615 [bacterium]|nr:hypothetical protein [bacterium]